MFSVFIMTGTFKSFGVLYVELLSIFHSNATMASIVQGLLIFTNSIVCEYNDIAERIPAKLFYPKYQKVNHTTYCHYYNKKQRCWIHKYKYWGSIVLINYIVQIKPKIKWRLAFAAIFVLLFGLRFTTSRSLVIIGGILFFAGFLTSSFAESVEFLFFSYSFLIGMSQHYTTTLFLFPICNLFSLITISEFNSII